MVTEVQFQKFQIKGVCTGNPGPQEKINLKVEVYRKAGGLWTPYGTDSTTFTNMEPNPGGNITVGSEWKSIGIITSSNPGSHSNWRFKFTITEAQGRCPGYSKTKEGNLE